MATKAPAGRKTAKENVNSAGKLTSQYLQLRQTIRDVDAMHAERTAPLREKLDELGLKLLDQLNKSGVDSMSNTAGTVYKKTKSTATVKDGEALIDFIIEEGYIDLLERRANVTAVKEYLEEKQELPPGVELSEIVVIGVRKK